MNNSFKIIAGVLITLIVISCNMNGRAVKERATNKILQILVSHNQDSIGHSFKVVDSLDHQKIKHVTYHKKTDSIAIYFKSADSLRFHIPLTKKQLHQYALRRNLGADSIISNKVLEQWNEEIQKYKPHKWTTKE
jgi:hypothetical protein